MANRPCILCRATKDRDQFYWYPYTTNRGKRSIRRESRCIECSKARSKKVHAANPRKGNEACASWRKRHAVEVRRYAVVYRTKAKSLRTALERRRQAAKLKRTPAWADWDKIRWVYDNAPPGFEVDHILPLQGKFVSGLHVHENLRVLPKLENRQKHNKFEVT